MFTLSARPHLHFAGRLATKLDLKSPMYLSCQQQEEISSEPTFGSARRCMDQKTKIAALHCNGSHLIVSFSRGQCFEAADVVSGRAVGHEVTALFRSLHLCHHRAHHAIRPRGCPIRVVAGLSHIIRPVVQSALLLFQQCSRQDQIAPQ